jgi:hypothetical protein
MLDRFGAAAGCWLRLPGLAHDGPLQIRKLLFGLEREIGTKMLCHLDLIITKVRFGAAPRSGFAERNAALREETEIISRLQHDHTP